MRGDFLENTLVHNLAARKMAEEVLARAKAIEEKRERLVQQGLLRKVVIFDDNKTIRIRYEKV